MVPGERERETKMSENSAASTKKRKSVYEVRAHYDVSNEFFQLFTDPKVTYSCAYFPGEDMTMEEAQIAKLDLSLGKLGLKPGMTLLDVGCGWGSMMKRAIEKYDVNVVGVTLSKNQHAYCEQLLSNVETDRSYKVLLQDWSEVSEPVDRIDPDLGDGVGVVGGDGLDLDPAIGRQHAQVLLGRAVEGEAGVVLLGDVRGQLDPHRLDSVALDVHAEDVAGVGPGLLGVVGQLDPAGLAAPTDLHLGLDHDRVADAVGGGHGLVDGGDGLAGAHRDAIAGEELFSLVLEEIQGPGLP